MFATLLLGLGCDETADEVAAPTEPVTIRFAAVVGELPWRCGQLYQNLGSTAASVQPQDLRFFTHGFELVRADGSTSPMLLDDVPNWQANQNALLDFEDGAGKCNFGTPDTRTEVTGKVAPGDYVGLRFSVGVSFAENHKNAAVAPAPLAQSPLSWNWQQGYIFLRFEGGTPAGRYEVHLGSTGCAGTTGNITSCARPDRPVVSFATFDPATQTVIFDVKQLLADSDLTRNAGDSIGCASAASDPDCEGPFSQLGLDLATGAVVEGQDVFRAE
jgi:uncharacterized repeat protein (TIGR04052 family)